MKLIKIIIGYYDSLNFHDKYRKVVLLYDKYFTVDLNNSLCFTDTEHVWTVSNFRNFKNIDNYSRIHHSSFIFSTNNHIFYLNFEETDYKLPGRYCYTWPCPAELKHFILNCI